MQHKSHLLKVLTLILAVSMWWMSENFNTTTMSALAASSQNIGRIISINNGTVERQQPGETKWQKVGVKTILNFGDLLRTKSNTGKTVTVIINCTNPLVPSWKLSGDKPIIGVANGCPPKLPKPEQNP